ncbi:unnamed protein product [Callosobruchus maculatus]|uniref:Uncharacterized protein n=1 Tax=Callosobruchus maculatus TaxID=64391 RepID=A0A653DGI7_CALMS|nr:unnamed protein product [Callosobruchus maculatus]
MDLCGTVGGVTQYTVSLLGASRHFMAEVAPTGASRHFMAEVEPTGENGMLVRLPLALFPINTYFL